MGLINSLLVADQPFGLPRDRLETLGWRVLDNEDERSTLQDGLMSRFNKGYIPILRRDDSDEILCATNFSLDGNMIKVTWIEDYNDDGWEVIDEYDDISKWFSSIELDNNTMD